MINGQLWKLLDDEEMRKIEGAALGLLVNSGARIEHDGLLDILESAGCRVDRTAMRCRFTEKLIQEAVSRVGGKPDMAVEVKAGWDPAWRMGHGGSFPHLLEWPSGERRLATRQDIHDMAKMAHTLDDFTTVGRVLTCAEVDPRVEPLWTTLALAQTTTKPIGAGEVYSADYLEYLVRMGEVLSGVPRDNSLIARCDFFIQPLILEPSQAACFVEKRRLGCANVPGTMTVAGLSGPVTPAGVVALSLAELLAGWTLGYLLNPELPVGGIIATASLDMRTMNACFSSPEAILQNVTTSNIARRLYGIAAHPIVSYTDCKVPGLKAAFDKMFGLLCAPFSNIRGIGACGLLSAGQDYCPVQHIIDIEMNKAVERYWGHFEVNDDTLAVDLLEKVMRAPETNFLTADHTLDHCHQNLWTPRWLDRSLWRGGTEEKSEEAGMLKRIGDYCADAIRRYEPPELDAGKIRELEGIYQEAERKLC